MAAACAIVADPQWQPELKTETWCDSVAKTRASVCGRLGAGLGQPWRTQADRGERYGSSGGKSDGCGGSGDITACSAWWQRLVISVVRMKRRRHLLSTSFELRTSWTSPCWRPTPSCSGLAECLLAGFTKQGLTQIFHFVTELNQKNNWFTDFNQ